MENLSQKSTLTTDLDLNSIERVQLLSTLEDRFQLELDESSFASAGTIGDLESMLRQAPQHSVSFSYPRWAQRLPIVVFRALIYYLIIWPATVLTSYPRVRGRKNLKGLNGPVLFAANHITQVDVGFILAALPLRWRHCLAVAMLGEMLEEMLHPCSDITLLKRCLKKASYGLLAALFNVFPLPQKAGFRGSFAFAGESVDRGYSILVLPEGTRTRDGNLGPFRAGIGLLAKNLNIPVVPIRIDGLYELKRARKKVLRPGTVTVSIGPASRFHPGADPFEVARELEAQMRAL
jgi:long-chain acyl-CoA synthetase